MELEKAFAKAVHRGDIVETQKLIQQGVDTSISIDDNKQTALHVASFSGNYQLVETLLKNEGKVNVNARDEHNWTALLCAASLGHLDICFSLLAHGADPKIDNDQKTTALHYLCRKMPETLATETSHSHNPAKNTSLGLSATTSAEDNWSNNNNYLSAPSNHFVTKSRSNSSPAPHNPNLSASAPNIGSTTQNNYGLNKSAEINNQGHNTQRYLDLLELMIKKGTDINHQNNWGETPLMQACARGNLVAVEFLLKHNAKWKITNNKGETAMFYAEKGSYTTIVRVLQEKVEREHKKTLITYEKVKLENLPEVVSIMRDSDNGLALRDRKYLFITHKKVFLGSELVDWCIKNLKIRTRDEAVEYGQRLLDAHWITHVNKKKRFRDSKNYLCKFATGEAPVEEPEVKVEKVGIDDFEQIRVLGKGGFGKVVLAQKKDTKKIYALKLMDKQKILNKPRDFKNLMSEKKILQNDCCFLVHLYWAFQTETDFVLVMDFVGGGDLYYHWKLQRRFPEKAVQFIAAELVLAISYLHSCGIIYRDLKPQNILLDVDGHICLADFGLSKEVTQSTETGLHTACGTPSYSAPEVLEGSPYGKSADYWSLGIVLYQFLVGRPPFEFDGDFAKLLRNIHGGPINYPRQLVSENAQLLLEGLLSRDHRKRLDDPDVIKIHPFFKGVDWEKLEVKKVASPIKLESDLAKNFDPKYTRMPVNDDKEEKTPVPHVPEFSVLF